MGQSSPPPREALRRGLAEASAKAGSFAAGESWAITEYLIGRGRIGCIPGADFGPGGEGYLRFCFARDRKELTGAIDSLRRLFASCRRLERR